MPTILRNGLTHVTMTDRDVIVTHRGNMCNTVDGTVRPNVDELLGEGAFDAIRAAGTETGAPNYMYTLTAPISVCLDVLGVDDPSA